MKKAKLQRRLDRLTAQGRGYLRAARRAQAHLTNTQWEPTGLRTFIYSPWETVQKAKRRKTSQNVRAKEHITERIKVALFGPKSSVIRWAAGLRMRRGSR